MTRIKAGEAFPLKGRTQGCGRVRADAVAALCGYGVEQGRGGGGLVGDGAAREESDEEESEARTFLGGGGGVTSESGPYPRRRRGRLAVV